MDEQTNGGKDLPFLRSGAKLSMLYRGPGYIPSISGKGQDLGEEVFVAWSSAYLCHGAVECGDADRVFAAGFRAQQLGADPKICALNRQDPGGGILSGHGPD